MYNAFTPQLNGRACRDYTHAMHSLSQLIVWTSLRSSNYIPSDGILLWLWSEDELIVGPQRTRLVKESVYYLTSWEKHCAYSERWTIQRDEQGRWLTRRVCCSLRLFWSLVLSESKSRPAMLWQRGLNIPSSIVSADRPWKVPHRTRMTFPSRWRMGIER